MENKAFSVKYAQGDRVRSMVVYAVDKESAESACRLSLHPSKTITRVDAVSDWVKARPEPPGFQIIP